jgi:hypothetical protein
VGAELARAGDRDRELYLDHVENVLYPEGFIIGELELDEVREQVMKARSMGDLDRILTGMPLPQVPKEPRDWGIPKNFIPLFTVPGVFGLSLATLVPAGLSNFHGTPSKLIAAVSIIIGVLLVIGCVIGGVAATCIWENHGSDEKRERRARDPGW